MPETLQTVGIDIGTSTTSLILAELTIKNTANAFTLPHIAISQKRIVYRSPVIFTPLLSATTIDEQGIQEFVTAQYVTAGIDKQRLKMGAVILTGETARKQNADRVVHALSEAAGDFVCATAGPGLESVLAGKGADQTLLQRAGSRDVINIDIGGGTSNLARFHDGQCVDTACFDIGGRLIRVDSAHRVTYVAPKIKHLIERTRLNIQEGDLVTVESLQPLIGKMVTVLEASAGAIEAPEWVSDFITDKPLRPFHKRPLLTFSGGVADCLDDALPADAFPYGDIGLLLGQGVKRSRLFSDFQVVPTTETIQATVVGAGSQSMMVSGSTITYDHDALPLKNVPVIAIDGSWNREHCTAIATRQLALLQETDAQQKVGWALNGITPTFEAVGGWCDWLVTVAQPLIAQGLPLIVMIQENVAQVMGNGLRSRLPAGYPIVCFDSVPAITGDYVDVGEPVASGRTLPVVVKTLVFQ